MTPLGDACPPVSHMPPNLWTEFKVTYALPENIHLCRNFGVRPVIISLEPNAITGVKYEHLVREAFVVAWRLREANVSEIVL